MRLNNLFDESTYDRVVRAFREQGRLLIESVPEATQVSALLNTLAGHSALPLADRFYFSQRDGTIALHHQVGHTVVSLINVTQDYTYRCTDTFLDGWHGHFAMGARSSVRDPHLLPTVMPLFDDLQRFILSTSPSYLHQIRQDTIVNFHSNNSEIVYTVEVAHRYRSQGEIQLSYLDTSTWPHMNNYRRIRATPSQITIWAMLTLTPTDLSLDEPRLEHIRRVISAATSEPNDNPVLIPPGNMLSLLRVRHAAYMDGRARYAIMRSAITSRALLHRNEKMDSPNSYGPTLLQEKESLPQSMSNCDVIGKILIASILSTSLGLLYMLRLLDPNAKVEEVAGVSVAIMTFLFTSTMILWLRVFTGTITVAAFLRLRRPLSVDDMYKETLNRSARTRVEAATTTEAVRHYDGQWLSFSGLNFNEHGTEYPGRFSLKHLLCAGYQTTFAMDGREVLISPSGDRRMRMQHVDGKGFASFHKPGTAQSEGRNDELEIGMEVLPCARGVWAAYTPVR